MLQIHFDEFKILIGNNSLSLFDFFNKDELFGLTRIDCLKYKETNEDAYIYALCNSEKYIFNGIGKPFIFINFLRYKNTIKGHLAIMHECIHLYLMLYNYNLTFEEDIISDAEKLAEYLIELLNVLPPEDNQERFNIFINKYTQQK